MVAQPLVGTPRNLRLLTKAIKIATEGHSKQVDKLGKPYILHPLAVMLKMDTVEEMITAVLHDVLEDTAYTPEKLRYFSIPETVVEALVKLTHLPGVLYLEYIKGIVGDPLATKVKLADIEHNLSSERLIHLPEHTQRRLWRKYNAARDVLRPPLKLK